MTLVSDRLDTTYGALVAIATYDATATIDETLASVAESIEHCRVAGRDEPIAISVVDDCSQDDTVATVEAFSRSTCVPVMVSVNPRNRGRAYSRNRAVAQARAPYYFLDHDDTFLSEHIDSCLEQLDRNRRIDYVKTRVLLSDPVHPEWERAIAAGLTQNLCVRAHCHDLVGGFAEEPEVETYGCDDVLYNRCLRAFLRHLALDTATVRFHRRPGNSFERQYERKFSRPPAEAEVTLSEEQLSVASAVEEIHRRRLRQITLRMARLARLSRTGFERRER